MSAYQDHFPAQHGMSQMMPPRKEAQALPHRGLLVGLSLFGALSAIAGGLELIVWQHGNEFVPLRLLKETPFTTFLVPGLLLMLVVGGASALSSILVWRRSSAAIDATLLAGGALVVWLLAEIALLRTAHWLHALYGAVGLGLLGLGLSAAMRSPLLRHRWVIVVTIAEAIGYLGPSITGVLTARAGLAESLQATLLVAAGFFEGFGLGVGQALVFPFPVRRLRYALLTSLGAGAVWASVMAARLLGQSGLPAWLVGIVALLTGVIGLIAIGGLQWLELRRYTNLAHRWIGWTALAWVAALPFSFAPGPLVDEQTPLGSHLILWSCGGLLMAYVMALITWQGARRLLAPRVTLQAIQAAV